MNALADFKDKSYVSDSWTITLHIPTSALQHCSEKLTDVCDIMGITHMEEFCFHNPSSVLHLLLFTPEQQHSIVSESVKANKELCVVHSYCLSVHPST